VCDGAVCPSHTWENETSMVLAGLGGDPNCLHLSQGNFEAASLLLPDFHFLFLFIDSSIFCHNNSKSGLQTLLDACCRGV